MLRGRDGVVGSIAVRPSPEGTWIEHLHLARDLQGTGQGGAVLADVTAAADRTGTALLLSLLVDSDVRRLHARHDSSRTARTGST